MCCENFKCKIQWNVVNNNMGILLLQFVTCLHFGNFLWFCTISFKCFHTIILFFFSLKILCLQIRHQFNKIYNNMFSHEIGLFFTLYFTKWRKWRLIIFICRPLHFWVDYANESLTRFIGMDSLKINQTSHFTKLMKKNDKKRTYYKQSP